MLVEKFRKNTDKLLPLIEKHGYDRVMINSPNFGVNLPENVIADLQELHNSNDETDNEISKLFNSLPELYQKESGLPTTQSTA